MDETLDRDLIIEIHKDEDDHSHLQDDDTDESHCIYLINAILSGTARLNVLLPSATVLAFTIFAPLLTNDGKCSPFNRWLTGILLAICAASCIFFNFTDSFQTATGRLHYGVATFSGIWTFNGDRKKPSVPSNYRLRLTDLFHSSLSLIAFLTFAALHGDIVACYYPNMPKKVTNIFPLVVGFIVSVIFVIFPTRRRGLGYPLLLLKRDAFNTRR